MTKEKKYLPTRILAVFEICLCVLLSFTSVSAQTPIQINEGERIFIGKNIEYFVDTTQKLNVRDILNKTFTQCQTEILNLGNLPHVVWMRFSVSSKTEKELYFEIDAPLLSNLEIYEMHADTAMLLFTGGSNKPFSERPIDAENFILSLRLQDSAATFIYIKAQSIYPFQIPIALSAKNKFIEFEQLHYMFWGIYMGVMFFAFIYNFFIYLSVRDRSYLYYLLYILSSVAFYLGLEGFGFQFLWSNNPGINPMIPIFVSITNCVITLFTLRFLNINKNQKVLFYTGWTFIIIFILISILNIAGMFVVALGLSQMFSLLACI